MFTVEQRDALRERVLKLATGDRRVVAGADGVPIADVLGDWTATLKHELSALHLIDLERGPTVYRVFLLPEALQLDLSLTPAARFAPTSPRFRLLFGASVEPAEAPAPQVAADLFGWGVIYALHSRACIGRGRVWQAERYVGAVRDHALSLACLRRGLPAVQARGYDDLPGDVLALLDGTHVGSLEPARLRSALSAAVRALLDEGREAGLPGCGLVSERLAEL